MAFDNPEDAFGFNCNQFATDYSGLGCLADLRFIFYADTRIAHQGKYLYAHRLFNLNQVHSIKISLL